MTRLAMIDRRCPLFDVAPTRRVALAALSVGLLLAAPAQAFAPDSDADREAREAQQTLSDRYTALWNTLSPGERPRFAQAERAWLNHTRWLEQRRCVETARAAGATDMASLPARCLADVTRQRIQTLAQPALAAR
jgi:uncharacterized protein YecT (DUF1311 family)